MVPAAALSRPALYGTGGSPSEVTVSGTLVQIQPAFGITPGEGYLPDCTRVRNQLADHQMPSSDLLELYLAGQGQASRLEDGRD